MALRRSVQLRAAVTAGMIGVVVMMLSGPLGAQTVSEPEIRAAVERALPLLQTSASTFVAERACFSCHHNALPILTLHSARVRGFAIDNDVLAEVERRTFRPLSGDRALSAIVEATELSDPTPNDSMLLMAAHAAEVPRTLVPEIFATRLAAWQRDGYWATSDFRPPHSYSLFKSTATAIGAVRAYMPDELAAMRDQVVERGRQWLVQTRPQSTEDAAYRLMGLVWASASKEQLAAASRDLAAMELPSGGWPQTPRYAADAYSTGEALFALAQAGMASGDPMFQKGARFLISSQAKDGTWHVHTRMVSPADVSPPYFETGFPYGHDQVLSYAGSEWAVLGLLNALKPEVSAAPGKSPEGSEISAAPEPAWVRAALFGTADEMGALLKGGLDPNSEVGQGTTLLMLAAGDPVHGAGKVRLLLDAGADPAARAASGVDALTVAASYRGTRDVIEMLLDAGAPEGPGEEERVANTALGLASMTGDLDNVRLLLERGADPNRSARNSGTPLASAITFGYPEVAQALIDGGANVHLTEDTGVNLLHWAAITDRAELIPVLAAAGVPLNDFDYKGFTPVMYAASVDHGDTRTLRALLDAGADPNVPTDDGLTALQEAVKLGHEQMADVLRRHASRPR